MKRFQVLVLFAAFSTALAQTPAPDSFCLRNPARVLESKRIDLSPLFAWWTANAGKTPPPAGTTNLPPRPLSAWVRVNGLKVEDASTGWVLMATLESRPGLPSAPVKIVLGHPPVVEAARLKSLLAQKQRSEIASDQAAAAAARSGNAASNAASMGELAGKMARLSPDGSRLQGHYSDQAYGYRSAARRNDANAANAASEQETHEADLKAINEAIAAIPTEPTTEGLVYRVDAFALATGRTFRGLPVYDIGMTP